LKEERKHGHTPTMYVPSSSSTLLPSTIISRLTSLIRQWGAWCGLRARNNINTVCCACQTLSRGWICCHSLPNADCGKIVDPPKQMPIPRSRRNAVVGRPQLASHRQGLFSRMRWRISKDCHEAEMRLMIKGQRCSTYKDHKPRQMLAGQSRKALRLW
jgi:hypothetical protein